MIYRKSLNGVSIIEIMLAIAIFMIIAGSSASVVLQGFDSNRLSQEEIIATQFASEGIEVARSIKNRVFSNLTDSSGTGVALSGGNWTYSGSNNTYDSGKYTRVIKVESVYKDSGGNIVTSGGTLDPDSKKVTSTVTWNFKPTRPQTTQLITYFTDWKKPIKGNWKIPLIDSTVDITNTFGAVGVVKSGSTAYIIRSSGSPNSYSYNVSNTSSPTAYPSNTLNLATNPTSISPIVNGSFTYVSNSSNSNELQIVNISNPSAMTIAGNYNAGGNTNPTKPFSVGSTVYLPRLNNGGTGGDAEFIVINASTPATPSTAGSLQIATGNLNAVWVKGNYAYTATSDTAAEVKIVNITNPASMSQSGYNLTGTSAGTSIYGYDDVLLVGRADGTVVVLDITSPTAPTVTGTYPGSGGGQINYIAVNSTDDLAYLATTSTTAKFQVIDLSDLSSPYGTLNTTSALTFVVYDETADRCFVSSSNGSGEFVIIKPS